MQSCVCTVAACKAHHSADPHHQLTGPQQQAHVFNKPVPHPVALAVMLCRQVAITIQKCWRGYLGRQRFAAVLAAHNTQLRQVGTPAMSCCLLRQSRAGQAAGAARMTTTRTCADTDTPSCKPAGLLCAPCNHHPKVLARLLQQGTHPRLQQTQGVPAVCGSHQLSCQGADGCGAAGRPGSPAAAGTGVGQATV
jgi:hypothetical protein